MLQAIPTNNPAPVAQRSGTPKDSAAATQQQPQHVGSPDASPIRQDYEGNAAVPTTEDEGPEFHTDGFLSGAEQRQPARQQEGQNEAEASEQQQHAELDEREMTLAERLNERDRKLKERKLRKKEELEKQAHVAHHSGEWNASPARGAHELYNYPFTAPPPSSRGGGDVSMQSKRSVSGGGGAAANVSATSADHGHHSQAVKEYAQSIRQRNKPKRQTGSTTSSQRQSFEDPHDMPFKAEVERFIEDQIARQRSRGSRSRTTTPAGGHPDDPEFHSCRGTSAETNSAAGEIDAENEADHSGAEGDDDDVDELDVSQDLYLRLYDDAKRRQQEIESVERQYRRKRDAPPEQTPELYQRLYKQGLARHKRIQRMHEEALEAKRREEEAIREQCRAAGAVLHSANGHSAADHDSLGAKLSHVRIDPQFTQEEIDKLTRRLYRVKKKDSKAKTSEEKVLEKLTFKPCINKNAPETPEDFGERLYRHAAKVRRRKHELLTHYEHEERRRLYEDHCKMNPHIADRFHSVQEYFEAFDIVFHSRTEGEEVTHPMERTHPRDRSHVFRF